MCYKPIHPVVFEIRGPGGQQWIFQPTSDQVTIGRTGGEPNDIELPDFCESISRRHCTVFRKNGKWYLLRQGKHFPLIRRKSEPVKGEGEEVHKSAKLASGDVIRLLGVYSKKQKVYWEICFIDRDTTIPPLRSTFLQYDGQQQLFRIEKGEEKKIDLFGDEHILFAFMYKHPGKIYRREELIKAVYGDENGLEDRTEDPIDSLRHLITRLRARIEPVPAKPCFLITHPGFGYSLHVGR
jgi:DNA-binding winged helix-turn-helix (wHTH) protein